MPRDDVQVGEIPSERWEIALGLLIEGGRLFLLPGETPVGLQRYHGFPNADGLIHVSVFTQLEPPTVTPEIAQRDARLGLEVVRKAESADPMLSQLLERFGVIFEYVCDYGNGAVKIGDIFPDGQVSLH